MDPTIVSIAAGVGAVVGWLAKHVSNGRQTNGKHDVYTPVIETRMMSAETLRLVQGITKAQIDLANVVQEIELRGRQ